MKALVVVNYADWRQLTSTVSVEYGRGFTFALGIVEGESHEHILERVFEVLNAGSGQEHPILDQCKLRSMSAHDMVLMQRIDPDALTEPYRWYVCDPMGWRHITDVGEAISLSKMTMLERANWSIAREYPTCVECGSRVKKVDEEGYCVLCADKL